MYLADYENVETKTRFLENQFWDLNYGFSVQVWYICLNLIDLSQKKVHFVYSKQKLRPTASEILSKVSKQIVKKSIRCIWNPMSSMNLFCSRNSVTQIVKKIIFEIRWVVIFQLIMFQKFCQKSTSKLWKKITEEYLQCWCLMIF